MGLKGVLLPTPCYDLVGEVVAHKIASVYCIPWLAQELLSNSGKRDSGNVCWWDDYCVMGNFQGSDLQMIDKQ